MEATQPVGLFGSGVTVPLYVEQVTAMPTEVCIQDGEPQWARGDARDGATVLVGVSRGEELSSVGLQDLARLVAGIAGVVPDEARQGDVVAVEPLEPIVGGTKELRWEVTPAFWLVQAGRDDVYLRAAPGSEVEWDGAALLTGPQAWRLVRALIAMDLWLARLEPVLVAAAEAARASVALLLEASAG